MSDEELREGVEEIPTAAEAFGDPAEVAGQHGTEALRQELVDTVGERAARNEHLAEHQPYDALARAEHRPYSEGERRADRRAWQAEHPWRARLGWWPKELKEP
jgi:hypothetical protein